MYTHPEYNCVNEDNVGTPSKKTQLNSPHFRQQEFAHFHVDVLAYSLLCTVFAHQHEVHLLFNLVLCRF